MKMCKTIEYVLLFIICFLLVGCKTNNEKINDVLDSSESPAQLKKYAGKALLADIDYHIYNKGERISIDFVVVEGKLVTLDYSLLEGFKNFEIDMHVNEKIEFNKYRYSGEYNYATLSMDVDENYDGEYRPIMVKTVFKYDDGTLDYHMTTRMYLYETEIGYIYTMDDTAVYDSEFEKYVYWHLIGEIDDVEYSERLIDYYRTYAPYWDDNEEPLPIEADELDNYNKQKGIE